MKRRGSVSFWRSQPAVAHLRPGYQTGKPCTLEGVVTRNSEEFPVDEFAHNVFKFVRKNHVKTTEHWKRNWQRARMAYEFAAGGTR
jgi:hypothetical protein